MCLLRKTSFMIFFIAIIVFVLTFAFTLIGPPTNQKVDNNHSLNITTPTQSTFKVPNNGIFSYMGKSKTEIIEKFGEPERIDPTNEGYQWYIYGRGSEKYIQIGIDNKSEHVSSIYALGKQLKTDPFIIEKKSRDIYKKVPLSDTVSLNYKGTKIDFEFNEDDLMVRPLIKFGKYWAQLNFDHMTDRLVGVRYMNDEVLVRQRPYSLTYIGGSLPDPLKLSDDEWDAVNQSEAIEIFDISNILRTRYNVKPLDWNKSASDAAYKHSQEMKERNYFSHDSKWSGDLSKRLQKEKVQFQLAGENIAAKYPDGVAVVIGWLNSEDHRKNLLNDEFTELGVGVYKDNYTQDFVTPFSTK
ncbi:CAP domain-containing protein [Terrilactibacillus laevilacticus]|nr:CAP domain-containing protein [Terrilactibacillus laevilacticus]